MQYSVAMEGTKLNLDPCMSLRNTLELCFALYFNFNLEYPVKACNTFELLQRYYCKLYPEQGTKNKKSKKLKIISFIRKVRDQE